MTIEEFFRLLLRNAVLLIVTFILGAAAGYGFSFTEPRVYQATALGFVSATGELDPEGNPIAQISGNMQLQHDKAQSYLPLFGTRAVGEGIAERIDSDAGPDALAGSVQATLDPNAPIITVTASAGSPEEASNIANAAVEATADEAERLETGGVEGAAAGIQLVPYQTALVPGAAVAPDRPRYAAAGAAVGLLLGLGLAWLRNRNDSRVRTVDDIRSRVDVPALGVLPDVKDLARQKDGRLPAPKNFQARESLRKLRTNLRFVSIDQPPRSIVVTSSAPGEGKSTVAANLARVMARAGQKTLLIDADLRRPVVAGAFGMDGSIGLTQLLAGSVGTDDAVQESEVKRLWVLPAGQIPPNPSELLGSRRMHDLVRELSNEYFVIIDAPPVLAVTDAQLLARHADGAMIVAIPGRTRVEGISRAIESIHTIGASVLGVVMNRASSSRLTRIAYGDAEYGYGARYGYGATYGDGGHYGADVPGMEDVEDVDAPEGVEPEDGRPGPDQRHPRPAGSTASTGGRRRAAPRTGDDPEQA
ncbi:MAG: polysaccharide biosynthesis tyrosine autokinase [Brachybacterium sp.]|nr:polysaccharide biosynthesis tyrosine autokinase [Brachybacterium sp.]